MSRRRHEDALIAAELVALVDGRAVTITAPTAAEARRIFAVAGRLVAELEPATRARENEPEPDIGEAG